MAIQELEKTQDGVGQEAVGAIPTDDLNITAPGKLRVIKRNGKVVPFEEDKIKVAVTKAFLANESGNAAASERIHRKVEEITAEVQEIFKRRMPSGGTLHIEEIQDQVELQLMRNEEYIVARKYILYREERAAERTKDTPQQTNIDAPNVEKTITFLLSYISDIFPTGNWETAPDTANRNVTIDISKIVKFIEVA